VADADLQRDLQRFREAYRRKLPGKLDQLDALLRGARGAQERGQLEAARDLAHMLKGTSGSYGFGELSAELRRIEEHLDRLLDGESPDSPAVWSEIEHALNRAGDHLCRRDTGAP
jgi:HPt (histidine-containing phosphotransfer) domain-containing protein